VAAARRVHVLVSGRVQGVWFRAQARDRASALGVGGFARNLADGRVEIEAQGEPERVDAFLAWCREGPPGARVERVEVSERLPIEGALGFEVQRG
jgi:acylphosphatase